MSRPLTIYTKIYNLRRTINDTKRKEDKIFLKVPISLMEELLDYIERLQNENI